MAENDIIKRSLEAGLNFTQMTRERAKEIVQDLVKEGKISSEQATKAVEDVLNWSKKTTEHIRNLVATELKKQIDSLGLVRRNELTKLLDKFVKPQSKTQPAKKAAAKKAIKAPAKKATKVAKKKA